MRVGDVMEQIGNISPAEDPIIKVTELIGTSTIRHIHRDDKEAKPLTASYDNFEPTTEKWDKEDDWNLAKNGSNCPQCKCTTKERKCIQLSSFKMFILKLKKDVDDIVIAKYNTGWQDWKIKVNDVINKRVGDQ
ncbi:hypothetical protein LCGC14_2625490 [marine sediment metagenome]|uniref:Uncharacterized protein n=1 Tax=marine sediment metagenome TaxID=412755 RepID=A0A0F9A1W7_9ZZZZ